MLMSSAAIHFTVHDHPLQCWSDAKLTLSRLRSEHAMRTDLCTGWKACLHRLGSVFASLYCWREAAASFQQGLELDQHNKELVRATSCWSSEATTCHS